MANPAIRGAVEKALLADLGTLRRELFDRVCEGAGREHLRAIEEASRIAWVDIAHGIALRDAAVQVLGRTNYARLIHALTMRSLDVPAFKTLGAGLLRMFEASPAGLARASARAWSTFTRSAGLFEFRSDGPTEVTAMYLELTPAMIASPGLLATHEGSFRAALDLAGAEGSVTREDLADEVHYRIKW